MFSSKTQLAKHTPENGTDRENFLSLLVDEYLNSTSHNAKQQVLANLANFAYDPINYGYIRDVGVLDIFLYVLKKESDTKLLHFASAGICNLCVDPLNVEYILTNCGLKPLIALLKSNNSEIVANIITTLLYINNEETISHINSPEVKEIMTKFKTSDDKILANLATVFLENLPTS